MKHQNDATPRPFWLGCNYWASHAGTAMWSDWQPEVVRRDLDLLAQSGIDTLRVFPLWPDFQPIRLLRKYGLIPYEYRLGEEPLPATEEGRAGVSAEMLARFGVLADEAHARGLRLVVGLITGWMSGRLFVPPALENKNVITDPEAIMWQVRFVRCFVRRFRDHPALAAWDLGNECNCMSPAGSRHAAWLWTAALADAIRAEDQGRPVISGMHGLNADTYHLNSHWKIEDQGELTDILTVHPYPLFTPHCDRDPINTLRSGLHATAESVLYSDVGGKPCFAEEVGTLGPSVCSDEIAGDYLRTILFSLWSHGDLGMLWWCAFDQAHLEHAPYDWVAIERKLGLFRGDFTAKPVAGELRKFSAFLKQKAPVLAERVRDAVCLLTEGQDMWGTAFATFLLAKQAGFDLAFQTSAQPLRPSNLYLLPSLKNQPSRRFSLELMERVQEGATLYVSVDDPTLSDAREWFGVEVQTRRQRVGPAEIEWQGQSFRIASPIKWDLRNQGAEVLASEADGNPAFTRCRYGKGTVYFLTVPLETFLIQQPGVFHEPAAIPFRRFYEEISAEARKARVLQTISPSVGITEHPRDDRFRHAVLINYGIERIDAQLRLSPGWSVQSVLHGAVLKDGRLGLAPHDGAILVLVKTE